LPLHMKGSEKRLSEPGLWLTEISLFPFLIAGNNTEDFFSYFCKVFRSLTY
jgi:hypothetical protein